MSASTPQIGDPFVFRGEALQILRIFPHVTLGYDVVEIGILDEQYRPTRCTALALDAVAPYGDAAGSWCLPGVEEPKQPREGAIVLEPARFELNQPEDIAGFRSGAAHG